MGSTRYFLGGARMTPLRAAVIAMAEVRKILEAIG